MTVPSVVLIHKVPAIWEAGAKSQSDNFIDTSSEYNLLENMSNEEAKILENLESDIFFLLAKSIASYLEVAKIDIILGNSFDLRKFNNKKLEKNIKESDFVFFLAFDVGGSTYLKKYQKTFNFLIKLCMYY